MRCIITHRGKRSQFARQRRDAYQHLTTTSFRDQERAEIVCTTYAITSVENYLKSKYESVEFFVRTVPGEVLVTARGDGSLQK